MILNIRMQHLSRACWGATKREYHNVRQHEDVKESSRNLISLTKWHILLYMFLQHRLTSSINVVIGTTFWHDDKGNWEMTTHASARKNARWKTTSRPSFCKNLCTQRFRAKILAKWLNSIKYERAAFYWSYIVSISQIWAAQNHQRKINSVKQKVKFTRHAVSQSQSTHAFLHVHLSSHFAAVHLIIHSFHVQEHQGQIFFSSFYDYFLCCTHSKSVITLSLIAEYVQTIYDIYYQSEQWDFSPKISYVSKKHEDYISL